MRHNRSVPYQAESWHVVPRSWRAYWPATSHIALVVESGRWTCNATPPERGKSSPFLICGVRVSIPVLQESRLLYPTVSELAAWHVKLSPRPPFPGRLTAIRASVSTCPGRTFPEPCGKSVTGGPKRHGGLVIASSPALSARRSVLSRRLGPPGLKRRAEDHQRLQARVQS